MKFKRDKGGKPISPPALMDVDRPSNGKPQRAGAASARPKVQRYPEVPLGLPWRKALRQVIACLPEPSEGYPGRQAVIDALHTLCLRVQSNTPEQAQQLFKQDVAQLKRVVSKSPALRDRADLQAALDQLEQTKI